MSTASDYMTTALEGLDSQLSGLQTRLAADAAALQDAIAQVKEGQADTAALEAAAGRVQATADLVGSLAQPSAVVDEGQPDVTAGEIPAEGTGTDAGGQTPPQEENPVTAEDPANPAF